MGFLSNLYILKGVIYLILSPKLSRILECCPEGVIKIFGKWFLNHLINKYAKVHLTGAENLKNKDGAVIFICNHLSNSDSLVLCRALKQWEPTFVAGVKLNADPVTHLGMITMKNTPIVPNSADKAGISRIINLLKSGENILIFPEGTRSRKKSLIKAKPGLSLFAKMSKAKLVPIGMYGTEKLLPIGEDGNMSGETFHHADVYLNIGKPFEIAKRNREEDRKEYEERATDEAMKKIAELLPEEYRGVYK
jgi:1-acyl-sn-glycerol-3-phosphate acyltransferase